MIDPLRLEDYDDTGTIINKTVHLLNHQSTHGKNPDQWLNLALGNGR